MSRSYRAICAAALFGFTLSILAVQPAKAANVWDGGGTTNLWGEGLNWDNNVVPLFPVPLTFASPTSQVSSSNNLSGVILKGINFSSGAPSYMISGNAVTLGTAPAGVGTTGGTGGGIPDSGGIANNSTNSQAVSLPLILASGKHYFTTSTAPGDNLGSLTLSGTITRQPHSTAAFIVGTNVNSKINTTLVNDSTGIIGAWATTGVPVGTPLATTSNASWASRDASGNIVPFTAFSQTVNGGDTLTGTNASSNVKFTGGGNLTIPSGTAMNTFLISEPSSTVRTMTLGGPITFTNGGGIYRTENTAAQHSITGGSITAGTSGPAELYVRVRSLPADSTTPAGPPEALNLDSPIVDNAGGGAVTLIKSGYGVMRLRANSSYSGGTYVNEGQLRPENNNNAMGTGPVYVAADAQVLLSGSFTFPNNYFINGLGPSENGFRGGALRLNSSGLTVTGTVTLVGDARIGSRGSGTTTGGIITGQITGNFALELNNVGTTASTLTISNLLNNWSGDTTISNGTLRLGNSEVIPDGAGFGNVTFNAVNATDQPTVFDLNGFSETINGMSSTGSLSRISITNRSGSGTLTVGNNNGGGNYGGAILDGAGTVALTKIGNGTITLSGATASTYSGGTIVKAGKLIINTTVLSSGAVNLQTSATGAGTLYGSMTVGNVTLDPATGANKAIINPGSTGPGSAGTINMSTLNVGAGSGLQFDAFSAASFDQIHVTGTLTFGGATTITPTFTVSGTPITVIQADGGFTGPLPTLGTDSDSRLTYGISSTANSIVVTASGSVANLLWTGSTDAVTWDLHSTQNFKNTGTNLADKFFNGDNVTFDGTGSPNFTVNVVGGVSPTSMTVNNATGTTYAFNGSGFIGGNSTLTKSGLGALTLATNNVFTGGVTLTAGTLNINNNGALGLPSAAVTGLTINGGVLDNTSGTPVTQVGNPTQAWNTDIVFTGTNDLNLGTGAVTLTNVANSTNRSVTVNGSTLTVGGVIADSATGVNGITKLGAGTLALTAANTFTGPVTINQGTVKIGDGSALGSNTVPGTVVASGAALDFGGFAAANAPGVTTVPIKISGTGVGGHGALTNSGGLAQQNAIQSVVTLAADASVGGTSRFDIRNGGLILAGHTLTKNDSNQFVVSGVTIDAGNIVVNQGIFGIDGFTNVDTAGGSITVNASGNLQFSANNGTVTRPITVVGAGTISDATAANGTATVGSNITLQGNAIFASTNASTLTLSNSAPNTGVISESGGARSLTKTGPGTLVLQNPTNNYTGGTNLNGGAINIAAIGSLGTGPLTFDGGTVQYAPGLTADVSILPITLNAGGGGIDSNGNNINLTHAIGGPGKLTIKGNATVTLSGTNTYAGSTTIQQNTTLVVGSAGALPATTSIVLDATGASPTLDLNGRSVTVTGLSRVSTGSATIGSSSTTAGSTLVFAGGGSPSNFSGTIQDSVGSGFGQTTSLTVNSGSLTLSGSNSYTGTTRVNGGTLALATNGFLSSTSPLVLAGGKFGTGGLGATLNTLNVLSASTLDFGNGASALSFTGGTPSSSWGGLLTISNWTGNVSDPKLGGGSDQFLISGLSANQLQNRIKFDGFPLGAQLAVNNPGEVVPSTVAYARGDFTIDANRQITTADIPAMLTALTDLNVYKTLHNLSDADLLVIGDVNQDGAVNNKDIQAELNLISGAGSMASVPEPAGLALLAIGGAAVLISRRRCRA